MLLTIVENLPCSVLDIYRDDVCQVLIKKNLYATWDIYRDDGCRFRVKKEMRVGDAGFYRDVWVGQSQEFLEVKPGPGPVEVEWHSGKPAIVMETWGALINALESGDVI